MAQMEFTPKKRKKVEPVTFTLGLEPDQGEHEEPHVYNFNPPKQAAMMLPVLESGGSDASLVTGPVRWLIEGLGDDDTERIMGRLRDPDDDMDFEFLQGVINALVKQVSQRPTK